MNPDVTVVDASAAVEALLPTGSGSRVRAALHGRQLAAPAHLDAEVLSALARRRRAGDLDDEQVREALGRIAAAPVRRYALQPLLLDAWSLHDNVAAGDALYVALARRLGSVLITADARLAGAPGLGISVTVV